MEKIKQARKINFEKATRNFHLLPVIHYIHIGCPLHVYLMWFCFTIHYSKQIIFNIEQFKEIVKNT